MTGIAVPDIITGIEAETHIDTSLVSYVRQLQAKGYRIACLSNGTREWTLRVIIDHDLGDLFEQVVLSGDLGIVKPSPGIYTRTLEILRISAAEAIFVDDRKTNVDAAIDCGMRGILFTNTPTFEQEFERIESAFSAT